MHFGIFCLNSQWQPKKLPRDIYIETAEQIQLAEKIGFEIAWFAEHHFSSYSICPSPLMMTTYMAGQTSKIKLGTAVLIAPLYDPIRLVEDISMADQLSNGRLVLGFGTGYQEYEFYRFGRTLTQARIALFDVLDIVDAFLSQDEVSFKNERITLPKTHFAIRPIQKRPNIYLTGMATDIEAQRRSVQRGYIPFFTTGWNKIEWLQQNRKVVESTYAEAGGNPNQMPYAIQRYVCVTDNPEEILTAAAGARYVRRLSMAMRNNYGELDGSFLKEIPAPDEPDITTIASRLPIGDPDTVANRLIKDIEELSPNHISLFMGIPGLSQPQILKSMQRFATEVIPRLEHRFGNLSEIGY